MAQFVSQRDVDFFDGLNSELIDSIIDTKINVFKVSLHDTEVNLYGESMSKVFFSRSNCWVFDYTRRFSGGDGRVWFRY